MCTPKQTQGPMLTPNELQKAVFKRLQRYKKFNLLEHFAMFMGTAQLLEGSLKQLLHRKYGIGIEDMGRWTMGRVARVLRDRGVRGDFCHSLDRVVEYRNEFAHELLAQEAMLRDLLDGRDSGRLTMKQLEHGTYALEELLVVYQWLDEHDAW